MRTKGRIASWNDDKGYGFIAPLDGGKQIFIHVSALGNRHRRPEVNEVVSYSLSKDARGRICAANATLAGDKLINKAPRRGNGLSMLAAVVFLIAVAGSAMIGPLPIAVPIAYLLMSLVAFVAYALDKSAARRGAWRTGEGTLLLFGLLGGWPGALIAQETLRHKSRKTSFRAAFWVTVLVNLAALSWFYSDDGRRALQALLG